jgi:predicted transcriptional regulator
MKLDELFSLAGRHLLGPLELLVLLRMALMTTRSPMSIKALSEALGWSASKTRQSIRLLLNKGFINEGQINNYRKGRPAKVYGLAGDFDRLRRRYSSSSELLRPLGVGAGLHSSVDELLLTVAILDSHHGTNYVFFDSQVLESLGLEQNVVQSSLETLVTVGWLHKVSSRKNEGEGHTEHQMYRTDLNRLLGDKDNVAIKVDADSPNLFSAEAWSGIGKDDDIDGITPLAVAALCSSLAVDLLNKGCRTSPEFSGELNRMQDSRFSMCGLWLQNDSGGIPFGEIVSRAVPWDQFLILVAHWTRNAIVLEREGATKVSMILPYQSTANLLVCSASVAE